MIAMTASNSINVKARLLFILLNTPEPDERVVCSLARQMWQNILAHAISLLFQVHTVFPSVFPLVANLLHHLDIIADPGMARVELDSQVQADLILGDDFFLGDFVICPVFGLLHQEASNLLLVFANCLRLYPLALLR